MEPCWNGFNGLGRIDWLGKDGERVRGVERSLLLSIGLDITVMGGGDPIGLGIHSFAQRDLEVRVHGVADVPIRSSLVRFSIPFDS